MLIFDGDFPMGSAYACNVDITLPIAEVRATQPVGLAGEDVTETRELIASTCATGSTWGVRVLSLTHYGISSYAHGTGTDTDGRAGSQGAPKEIDTVADFQRIGERLRTGATPTRTSA